MPFSYNNLSSKSQYICFSLIALRNAKIAIVCDWLTNQGGAEKVVLGLHRLFPAAPIYTALYNPKKVEGFQHARIHTSSLQKIPLLRRRHQLLLSLMPSAFENFNLDDFDLVISSSHSCAKGIVLKPQTLHVCYCHSPMRYAWDNHQKYIREYSTISLIKKSAQFLMHKIRLWDRLSADRVDHFIANSAYIGQRIAKFYRRKSVTIHPFIDPASFSSGERSDFFLAVGRLTSYKKFDLLVEAFNTNGLPLKIAGTGNMENRLRDRAGKNIEFLGFVSDSKLKELYSTARALVFPQKEDFGIIPLEAMASGCPVIAYGRGGALETIVDQKTGLFFHQQSPESLNQAIEQFQGCRFDHEAIARHGKSFSQERFNRQMLDYLHKIWHLHQLTLQHDRQ